MKVEVLYLAGCPNYSPTIERVREILAEEETVADVVAVEIKDAAAAQRLGFLGSPTIRVEGVDIEPPARTAEVFGLTCRTYVDGGRQVGLPPAEWIRHAVREARGTDLVSAATGGPYGKPALGNE